MLRHEVCDLARELLLLKALLRLAQLNRQRCRFVAAPLADGEQELQDVLLRLRRDVPDHAQINQSDAIIIGQKNISRMRVCVKDSVNQNLSEVSAEKLFGQTIAVYVHQRQRT